MLYITRDHPGITIARIQAIVRGEKGPFTHRFGPGLWIGGGSLWMDVELRA